MVCTCLGYIHKLLFINTGTNRSIDNATSLYNIKKKSETLNLEEGSKTAGKPPGVIQGGVNGPIRVNI